MKLAAAGSGSWMRRHRCRHPCPANGGAREPLVSAGPRPRTPRSPGPNGRNAAPSIAVSGPEPGYPDGKQALHDVSFEVFEGEVLALIGPSGCGTSTALECFDRMHVDPGIRIGGKFTPADWDIHTAEVPRSLPPVFTRVSPTELGCTAWPAAAPRWPPMSGPPAPRHPWDQVRGGLYSRAGSGRDRRAGRPSDASGGRCAAGDVGRASFRRQIRPASMNSCFRGVSGRGPTWPITSAAAITPIRPQVSRGCPVASPNR